MIALSAHFSVNVIAKSTGMLAPITVSAGAIDHLNDQEWE